MSLDILLYHLKKNLYAATNRIKQVVDSKLHDMEFQEGDLVFLKLYPYQQKIVFKQAS